MFNTSYTIGHVWDIPVKLHITLLFILPWVLGDNLLGSLLIIAGVLASITAHELAHCYVSLKNGSRVKDIKLTLIGGVASIYDPPDNPTDEILMAAAGPAASLVLGLVLCGLSAISGGSVLFMWLGAFNLIIGIFNLLPAIPMDGGRILRAALARRQGYVRGTFTATRLGKTLAILLAILSFRFGFTLFLIAVFVYIGATAEYAQARIRSVQNPGWFKTHQNAGDNEVEVSSSPWSSDKPNERIRMHRD